MISLSDLKRREDELKTISNNILNIMEICIESDETCKELLNLSDNAYEKLLKENNYPYDEPCDARICSIKESENGSLCQCHKIHKLRMVIQTLI